MARDFDGNAANYLSSATIPVSGHPVTFCCWANLDDVTTTSYPAAVQDNAPNQGFGLRVSGSTFYARCNSANVAAPGTLSTGVWYHLLGTIDGSNNVTAFLDGSGGTPTLDSGFATPTLNVVGNAGSLTAPLNGRVAEYAIWTVVLNQQEISALASGRVLPIDVRPESLVRYYPLHGLASPEPNWGSTNNSLTMSGTVNAANHAPVIPFSSRLGRSVIVPASPPPSTIPPFLHHYMQQGAA